MSDIKPQETAAAPVEDSEENPAFTIVVSDQSLFNMAEDGVEAEEEEPLKPGAAFPLVKALMHVNERLRQLYPDSEELFDIVLMTDSRAPVGLRLTNSIKHYELTVKKFDMMEGMSLIEYLRTCKAKLYLSKDPEKVTKAIQEGIGAGTMFMPDTMPDLSVEQLRVAFDGDSVLFSNESERVYQQRGQNLEAYFAYEKEHEDTPLTDGPLKCFLEVLVKFQRKLSPNNEDQGPIRTFLVTSRSEGTPAEARARKTLRSWRLEVDELRFLGRDPKGPVLQKIKPHIFFDDQTKHITGAVESGTISAHVPYGI
ncbi:cytosolic 5'-nucleotidase 1A-like [Synchiropus picturatus]